MKKLLAALMLLCTIKMIGQEQKLSTALESFLKAERTSNKILVGYENRKGTYFEPVLGFFLGYAF